MHTAHYICNEKNTALTSLRQASLTRCFHSGRRPLSSHFGKKRLLMAQCLVLYCACACRGSRSTSLDHFQGKGMGGEGREKYHHPKGERRERSTTSNEEKGGGEAALKRKREGEGERDDTTTTTPSSVSLSQVGAGRHHHTKGRCGRHHPSHHHTPRCFVSDVFGLPSLLLLPLLSPRPPSRFVLLPPSNFGVVVPSFSSIGRRCISLLLLLLGGGASLPHSKRKPA